MDPWRDGAEQPHRVPERGPGLRPPPPRLQRVSRRRAIHTIARGTFRSADVNKRRLRFLFHRQFLFYRQLLLHRHGRGVRAVTGGFVALRHHLHLEADGLCDRVAREHAHVERVTGLARLHARVLGVGSTAARHFLGLEDALDAERTADQSTDRRGRLRRRRRAVRVVTLGVVVDAGCDVNGATAGRRVPTAVVVGPLAGRVVPTRRPRAGNRSSL